MPLIAQQDIVTVHSGPTLDDAVRKLHEQLEVYPDVRIVSISITFAAAALGISLVAVIETV